MRKLLSLVLAVVFMSACSDADIASNNISKAADNFEIHRRIIFYNGITGEYMLSVEGYCSIGSASETKAIAITCKTSPSEHKKHFLGLSDNITYFAEQIAPVNADVYNYRVTFKPAAILPNIEIRK